MARFVINPTSVCNNSACESAVPAIANFCPHCGAIFEKSMGTTASGIGPVFDWRELKVEALSSGTVLGDIYDDAMPIAKVLGLSEGDRVSDWVQDGELVYVHLIIGQKAALAIFNLRDLENGSPLNVAHVREVPSIQTWVEPILCSRSGAYLITQDSVTAYDLGSLRLTMHTWPLPSGRTVYGAALDGNDGLWLAAGRPEAPLELYYQHVSIRKRKRNLELVGIFSEWQVAKEQGHISMVVHNTMDGPVVHMMGGDKQFSWDKHSDNKVLSSTTAKYRDRLFDNRRDDRRMGFLRASGLRHLMVRLHNSIPIYGVSTEDLGSVDI